MEEQPQPPQSSPPPQYGFEQSKADQSRGSVPWFLLPFMILIRPDRFMLSWGIHANILWILIAVWLIGASGMINTVVNRVRLAPDSLPITIDSWATVWIIILGFGILRGIISYGIGGLWTWLRLRICGVRGIEWKRSTRIFCLSQIFEQSASLLALLYFSMKYDTLRSFIAQPVSLVILAAALFMLSSPIIAFAGVLACYKLRIVLATFLFLLIPMLWRVVLLGGLGYSLLTSTGGVLLPDFQHPVSHNDATFEFEHPKDWQVLEAKPLDEHTIAQVEAGSENGESSVLIRVLRRDGIDPNEHDLALIQAMGYSIVNKVVHSDARVGMLFGYAEEYQLRKDGKRYKLFHLIAGFDKNHGILVRSLSSQRYENASRYAVQQVVNSLVISSTDTQTSNTESQKEITRDWFTHQAPRNWYEGVESHAQYEYVEQRAFQDTYIRFTIYDRAAGGGGSGGAEKELSSFLEYGITEDEMISHEPMNFWLGFEGAGAKGIIWQPLTGVHDFWAIYVPLKDGRVLGIKKYQARSTANLTAPGFELIESTFNLLVEPAPVEP